MLVSKLTFEECVAAKDWATAERLINAMIAAGADGAADWYNLGKVRAATHRWLDAIEAFDAAVARMPTHADAWFELGRAAIEVGRLEHAADAFAQTLTHAPQDADAWRNLARLEERFGDFDAAEACWTALAQLCPGDPEAALGALRAAFELKRPHADALAAELSRTPALRPATLKVVTHVARGRLKRRPGRDGSL